ncbi:hypothetical protein THRCLA_21344 [Thraustotheca clavata]|uniref:BZIP domain-containing protein n=1 Tax=Thraustotheca clavata TaxID=74557 RepID=A0A1V9ZXI1_9STRA|nr:hypothetical protein THRCLA_21344 [Thraustotheca clavata]
MPPFETTPTIAPWMYAVPATASLEEPTMDHDLFAMMDFGILDSVASKKPGKQPKTEKRKLQVREASRRCRLKQKEEVVYLRGRVTELEQLLRDRTMAPSTEIANNSLVQEVVNLRQHNKELMDALQRSQAQMALIQALLNKNMLDTMQTITQTTPIQNTVEKVCPENEKNLIYDVVDQTVASLTSFTPLDIAPLVSIQRSNGSWYGDVWLCDTKLVISIAKEWPIQFALTAEALAERIWTRSATPAFAHDNYTLIQQETIVNVDSNTQLIRRVESLIEMKILEHSSIKFRRQVTPSLLAIGFTTYNNGNDTLKYTAGQEQLAILLESHSHTLYVDSVKLVGSYDVVDVPAPEIASRIERHVLNLAQALETRLLL